MFDTEPKCEFESKKLILRFETTIEARTDAIPPVVERIMELVQTMGCAAGKEHQVETALFEALANAVLHGCRNDACKKVECCVACDESHGMLIIIRDPGEGFDPKSIPSPVMGQNIFSTHGRGIFLINQLVDDVHYEKGGTEIHMRIA
ncbi:MAG TPA: ATP-binding protein [Terriglobales bacterium]|nr:ATP-binding protein [Terriglobales bacterium]